MMLCTSSDKGKNKYHFRCSKACRKRLWISMSVHIVKQTLKRSGFCSQQKKKKPLLFIRHILSLLELTNIGL